MCTMCTEPTTRDGETRLLEETGQDRTGRQAGREVQCSAVQTLRAATSTARSLAVCCAPVRPVIGYGCGGCLDDRKRGRRRKRRRCFAAGGEN